MKMSSMDAADDIASRAAAWSFGLLGFASACLLVLLFFQMLLGSFATSVYHLELQAYTTESGRHLRYTIKQEVWRGMDRCVFETENPAEAVRALRYFQSSGPVV